MCKGKGLLELLTHDIQRDHFVFLFSCDRTLIKEKKTQNFITSKLFILPLEMLQ